MVPDRNPWKEVYMEIYHKNKDQHDKGLSDEVLKDLLELQRINKIEPKKWTRSQMYHLFSSMTWR